jgi:hypothetical protein
MFKWLARMFTVPASARGKLKAVAASLIGAGLPILGQLAQSGVIHGTPGTVITAVAGAAAGLGLIHTTPPGDEPAAAAPAPQK